MAQPSKHPQSPSDAGAPGGQLGRLAAQSQLEFELEFFGAILARHPAFLEVLRLHAKNLAQRKRYAEGLLIDRRIIQLCPDDPLAHYNLACSYALLRQPDLALNTLRRAIELGYRDFRFMKEDRDLESIRQDPRFRQLLRDFDER
jgi:tetratricopeptide (TPR) repeat protein